MKSLSTVPTIVFSTILTMLAFTNLALATDNPCFFEIDPVYLQTNPNNFYHFQTMADAFALRAQVINFVWNQSTLPFDLPDNVQQSVSIDSTDLDTTGMTNLSRIDRLDINTEGNGTHVYVLWPSTSNSRLVLYHGGHDDALGYSGGSHVIRLLIKRGYTILAFHMPNFGPNTPPNTLPSHDHQMAFKFFLHPVNVALNHMTQPGMPVWSDITMTGVSGGGWTTMLYSAVDPRIKTSIPVAGPLPHYLLVVPPTPPCVAWPYELGEYELGGPGTNSPISAFYDYTASLLDLYALGALESGRTEVQVFNRFDQCCFGGVRYQTYSNSLINKINGIGGGQVAFRLDSTEYAHWLTDWTLYHVLLNQLEPPPAYPNPEPGLLAHLTFDESDTDRAFDVNNTGHTGALLGTAQRAAGVSGSAIDLNGVNGTVTFAEPLVGTLDSFSISVWVKGRTWEGSWQRPVYVEANRPTGATRNYLGIFGDQFGAGQFGPGKVFFDQYPNSWGFLVSNTTLSLNSWHHVVYTQTPSHRAIYIDGVLDAQDYAVESYAGDSPNNVMLGYRQISNYMDTPDVFDGDAMGFDGDLDEFKVYNRSISAGEVAALYSQFH